MAKKRYSSSRIKDEISLQAHTSYTFSRLDAFSIARSMGASLKRALRIAYKK